MSEESFQKKFKSLSDGLIRYLQIGKTERLIETAIKAGTSTEPIFDAESVNWLLNFAPEDILDSVLKEFNLEKSKIKEKQISRKVSF